jgi:hypothetical protein
MPNDLRERVARIIAPARFEGNNAAFPTGQESAFSKADAILALVQADEAAIRADERAKVREQATTDEQVARAIYAFEDNDFSMRAAILAALEG